MWEADPPCFAREDIADLHAQACPAFEHLRLNDLGIHEENMAD